MVKWYLVWIIVTPQADGTVDWKTVQEAKPSEEVCIAEMWDKNEHFEEIKLEDPKYSWAIYCTTNKEGQLGDKFKLDFYNRI